MIFLFIHNLSRIVYIEDSLGHVICLNSFPVGSHVVEHFEVHYYVHTSTINAPFWSVLFVHLLLS